MKVEMIEESEIRRLISLGVITSTRMVDASGDKYQLVFSVGEKGRSPTKFVAEYGLATKRSTDYRLFTEKAAIKWLRESGIREFSVTLSPYAAGQKGLF